MCAACIATTSKPCHQRTRGGTKVMPPVFSSETILTVVMKFTHFVGTSFTKLSLFFHRVFFITNTLFVPLHGMLNARCANLPVELLVLFTHSVLLLIVIYKWRPSRGQNDGSQTVLNQDCMEDEAEQSTALLQYLPLHRPVCSLALSGRRRTCFIFLFGRPFQLSV